MLPHERFFPIENDFRDPFLRDRDRVLHSQSFRKLEYKTQVFINHDGDYFRTRLTHSLEVSQIARTLCKNLSLNDGLAEVIALSHDLGHTPFGHSGGDELDYLLKTDGHTHGFDHNFQSFRVVTKIEKRYKEFDGLNLTYATLEGILKHSKPYDKSFLPDSLKEVFHIHEEPSLEAKIVDFSDEIAYISADIDDGIKYNLITFDDIKSSSLVARAIEGANRQNIYYEDGELFRYRVVANIITLLVANFIAPKVQFGFDESYQSEILEIKKLLMKHLYRHEKIATKMHYGKRVIRALYEAMKSDKNILPKEERVKCESRAEHRVIADYIASLSDRGAITLYKELFG